MKYIMIIIICFSADFCERMYEQEMYNSAEECIASSKGVADYMKEAFPNTAGQIFCLDEENFNNFQQQLENDPNYIPDLNQTAI